MYKSYSIRFQQVSRKVLAYYCKRHANRSLNAKSGFTLIELSIVLVIIGLVVGGVLVGQDLIRAAGVRATVTQVERINSAANTFFGKYNALPGDLNAQTASAFGFSARGSFPGQGDGNGIIQSNYGNMSSTSSGLPSIAGESMMFWVDLTYANGLNVNLMDGSFSAASSTVIPGTTITNIGAYLPQAKIGRGNFFYVWSGINSGYGAGTNYISMSSVSSIAPNNPLTSTPALTVGEAYSIDKKIDDGLPQTGNVLAEYVVGSTGYYWAAGGGANGIVYPNAAPVSNTSCYDNGNIASSSAFVYSVSQSGGSNVNCALTFKLQGGD